MSINEIQFLLQYKAMIKGIQMVVLRLIGDNFNI